MNHVALIKRLELNSGAFWSLLGGVGSRQARWKPAPDQWSALEVVCHLGDEEREDFRQRLRSTLADPSEPWPAIDPGGWVSERRYLERDLAAAVEDFLEERKQSVAWLNDLSSPAWENRYAHPLLGEITAGDLLASWVAHDFLHLRQLSRLHYLYAAALAEPHSAAYAGDW